MKSETIDKVIMNHFHAYNKDPKVILIHPNTYKVFMIELTNQMHGVDFGSIKTPKYRGVRICRTEDINENKVEVY